MFTPFAFVKSAAAPTTPFSPTDISNLVGWWDAGTGVSVTGNAVNSWQDLSSTTGDFSYTTGTKATYYTSSFGTNSKPYIHGVNGGKYTSTSNWPATSASTVFIVCSFYQALAGSYERYMEAGSYGTGFIFLDTSPSAEDELNFGFTTDLGTNLNPALNTPSVLRAKWNGTTNLIKLNNGTEISTGPVTLASQAAVPFYLFGGPGGSNGFDAAEIIVYNKVLSGGEMTQVENYISTEYGITL